MTFKLTPPTAEKPRCEFCDAVLTPEHRGSKRCRAGATHQLLVRHGLVQIADGLHDALWECGIASAAAGTGPKAKTRYYTDRLAAEAVKILWETRDLSEVQRILKRPREIWIRELALDTMKDPAL